MELIKVLLIEDSRIVQKAVTIQLESSSVWQFDLTAVDNMTSALKIKDEEKFDIILADLELPDSNRDSTFKILKNEFSREPFIILTATDDDKLLLKSLEAGARDYLCKDYLQKGALLSRTLYNAIQHWKMEQELKYIATHDDLTGAVNKKHFMKLLEEMIVETDMSDNTFCLVICDLDNFRLINNNYGHIVGDRALKLFVQTISSTIRRKDTVARFGGDEFCLLFPETSGEKLKKYLEKLTSLEIEIPGKTKICGSYGGSQYRKGITAEELLIEADQALYQVKENGKGFSKIN